MGEKVVFITFGGGKAGYFAAVDRISRQARSFDLFDEVHGWTHATLRTRYPQEYAEHEKLMRESRRGFGFWWWKPFIVMKELEAMDDGDILVYSDAGSELNIHGKEKMMHYLDRARTEGCLFFATWHKEKTWNKMDTLALFGFQDNDDVKNSPQIESGNFIIKKSPKMLELMTQWNEIHHSENHHHADNSASRLPNDPTFREHRHDQSILSLIVKGNGLPYVEDRRRWPGKPWDPNPRYTGHFNPEAEKQPFLCLRNISGTSRIGDFTKAPWHK